MSETGYMFLNVTTKTHLTLVTQGPSTPGPQTGTGPGLVGAGPHSSPCLQLFPSTSPPQLLMGALSLVPEKLGTAGLITTVNIDFGPSFSKHVGARQ